MKKKGLATLSLMILMSSFSQATYADALCLGFTWDDCNMIKKDIRFMDRGFNYGPIQGLGTILIGAVLFVPALIVEGDQQVQTDSLIASVKSEANFLGQNEQTMLAEAFVTKFNQEKDNDIQRHVLQLNKDEIMAALEPSDMELTQKQLLALSEMSVIVNLEE